MDLDNPPAGPDPGPQFYAALPRLNFGPEGYWELDYQAVGLDPNLTMRNMPRLEGWDADLTYYVIGIAFGATDDNLPMAVSIEETRDVDAGLFITPFVGTTFVIDPIAGGQLFGQGQLVTWGVHDGFEGPITPPSGNLILIEEPALGPPKPLWRYITPSLTTQFAVPELPEAAGEAGLGQGAMFLTVLPFPIEGAPLDFDDFTYNDLAQFRWKAWSTTTVILQSLTTLLYVFTFTTSHDRVAVEAASGPNRASAVRDHRSFIGGVDCTEIYTKILIGMGVGVALGLTVGPKSSFWNMISTPYQSQPARTCLDGEGKPGTKLVLPPTMAKFIATGEVITAAIKDKNGREHNVPTWVRGRIQIASVWLCWMKKTRSEKHSPLQTARVRSQTRRQLASRSPEPKYSSG